jgi:hypothetical protein
MYFNQFRRFKYILVFPQKKKKKYILVISSFKSKFIHLKGKLQGNKLALSVAVSSVHEIVTTN